MPKKQSKVEKDKPQRPLSAYNFFVHEERQRHVEQVRQGLRSRTVFSETSKAIAAKWKELNDAEKARYEEMAARDKRRYALEIINWKQQHLTRSESTDDSQSKHSQTDCSSERAISDYQKSNTSTDTLHLPSLPASVQSHPVQPQNAFGYPSNDFSIGRIDEGSRHASRGNRIQYGSLAWVAQELGEDGVQSFLTMFLNR